tara:strand:- start:3101 stop:4201 length:1101 start_codon:yes stop_codon:yes gene_type:complete
MVTRFQEKDCFDFQKLKAAADQDDVGKETWIYPCKDIHLETDYDHDLGAWSYKLICGHGGERMKQAVLNSFSFRQLCRKLKSPAKYMMQLPGNISKQALDYFKGALQDTDLSLKVKWRESGNHPDGGFHYVRGIVSPSTPLIANSSLISAMTEAVDTHGMRVWKAHFRDHDFHAKLIWGDDVNIGTEANPDNVNIGIHIGNSEVGARHTEIQMMIFRLVCTNGMINMVDGLPLYRRTAFNITRDQVLAEINNALHTVENRKDTLFGQFQDARNLILPKPFLILSRVAKKYSLSKAEVVAITEEFNQGQIVGEYGSSKIDLLNAITRVAQNYEQETRVKLETVAGKFLQDEEVLENPVSDSQIVIPS